MSHIVTDNQRAVDGVAALKAGDPAAFGKLMVDSHASQRDDYQITVPQTDSLVEAALVAGAIGSRQTGGGWGGAIVSLVRTGDVQDWCARMVSDHPDTRVLAVT